MTPLMTLGVLLIVLACVVVALVTASVQGVNMTWAGPLFLLGLVLAIIGAVTRR